MKYFDEWGNHIIYTLFFVACVFGFAAFIVLRNLNPNLISTDLLYLVLIMAALGLIFFSYSIHRKTLIEKELEKLIKEL
jgi:hypothetical protein